MVEIVNDQSNLVETKKFPFAQFNFPFFNPVQSRIFEHYTDRSNFLIAAHTAVGKTTCAEMFLSHEIHVHNKKGAFLAPLKSLTDEKLREWQKERFPSLPISIYTGDQKVSEEELKDSSLIIMTNEILNSKSRHGSASWLEDIGTLVIDESHGLGMEGRGDHLESAIIKFVSINPQCRLVLLSATMPNVEEIGKWISHITQRKTYILKSDYRPCPLIIHYVPYHTDDSYEENEQKKIETALKILIKHPEDKFILFVHSKKTGEIIYRKLKNAQKECAYYHADLPRQEKVEIEKEFRTNPALKCLIATSSLSCGINMPARRVIILGIHRGLQEVYTSEMLQMAGRSGRPQYDPCGDAYMLLPANKYEIHKKRLQTPEPILSQMFDEKKLAFHLVSEIHHQNIQHRDDIYLWYSKTLAYWQNQKLSESMVNKILEKIRSLVYEDKDGNLTVNGLGKVSSLFYFSPFDVVGLARNFQKLFSLPQPSDELIAMCLANVDSWRTAIVNTSEKEALQEFSQKVSKIEPLMTQRFTDGSIKAGYCYYLLLQGKYNKIFNSMLSSLKNDSGRLCQILQSIDDLHCRWEQKEYFQNLHMRITYGVPEEFIEIIQIPGIGKVKAEKLWHANLRTVNQIRNKDNIFRIVKALNCSEKVAEKICEKACHLNF